MDADESRYHHLLSTNDEPPHLEVEEIRKIIAHRQLNLSQLKTHIVEIENMLQSLIARQCSEEKVLSQFRAIVSPIRRLPRDILVEIFLHTRSWRGEDGLLPAYDFMSIPVGPLPIPSPLPVTHVCSQWRHVALSTPMLWATIGIPQSSFNQMFRRNSFNNDQQLLQIWLARTGSYYPLDITFSGGFHAHPISLTWIEAYIHRIKSLHLEGLFSDLPFDILETLSISRYDLKDCSAHQKCFPALRRVILRGEGDLPPSSFIPWQQLTHLFLDMEALDPTTLLDVLSQSTGLRKLHVSIEKMTGVDFATSGHEQITIPQLDTLIVYNDVDWLFEALTLPALTTLQVEFHPEALVLYDTFQTRSSCSLKSLIFSATAGLNSDDLVVDFLRLMPTLIEIFSEYNHFATPLFISSLTSRTDLVPRLEYLETFAFRSKSPNRLSDSSLLDMIAKRDCSGKPAVLQEVFPRGVKVFRSHAPKRSWDGQVRRRPGAGEMMDMIFF